MFGDKTPSEMNPSIEHTSPRFGEQLLLHAHGSPETRLLPALGQLVHERVGREEAEHTVRRPRANFPYQIACKGKSEVDGRQETNNAEARTRLP